MKTDIAIIIPSYNEGENLLSLCRAIKSAKFESKIYVVDDSEVLEESLKSNLETFGVDVFHRGQKLGRGNAVFFGLEVALRQQHHYFYQMDADGSHNPSELEGMLSSLNSEKADVVVASRYLGGSKIKNWPFLRNLNSKIANAICRTMLFAHVSDYTNGFRLYRRPAVETLVANGKQFSGKGFSLLIEEYAYLLSKKFQVVEVATVFENRIRGTSKFSVKELVWALQSVRRARQSIKNS